MAIVIHVINGKRYAYRKYRVGKKIVSKYLYPVDEKGNRRDKKHAGGAPNKGKTPDILPAGKRGRPRIRAKPETKPPEPPVIKVPDVKIPKVKSLADRTDEELEKLANFLWGKGMNSIGDDVNHYRSVRGFAKPMPALESSISKMFDMFEKEIKPEVTIPEVKPAEVGAGAGFAVNAGLINKDLANRSHAGTSFSPEIRGGQEINGFVGEVQEVYNELSKYAKSEAQKSRLNLEMERFQNNFALKWNEKLSSHSRIASTMITGGSNFPTRRMEKANDSYDKKVSEMYEWKDRAVKAIKRELKALSVEEAGGEKEVLKVKIANAEKLHEAMKKSNAILRLDIPDADKIKKIIEATGFKEETAAKMVKPDFAGRIGFTYELTNNSANIRRMKQRLAELEAKAESVTGNVQFKGGVMVDNAELDRIQLIFDDKPAQDVINKLKSSGWHWSPANKAWQRQRTNAAQFSAKQIIESLGSLGAAAPEIKTPEIVLKIFSSSGTSQTGDVTATRMALLKDGVPIDGLDTQDIDINPKIDLILSRNQLSKDKVKIERNTPEQ